MQNMYGKSGKSQNRKIEEDMYKYFNDIPFWKANHMPIPLVYIKPRVLKNRIRIFLASGVL